MIKVQDEIPIIARIHALSMQLNQLHSPVHVICNGDMYMFLHRKSVFNVNHTIYSKYVSSPSEC